MGGFVAAEGVCGDLHRGQGFQGRAGGGVLAVAEQDGLEGAGGVGGAVFFDAGNLPVAFAAVGGGGGELGIFEAGDAVEFGQAVAGLGGRAI